MNLNNGFLSRFFALALAALLFVCAGSLCLAGCSQSTNDKITIKMLILPHAESGEITGDSVGEAQLIYEKYLADSSSYTLANGQECYVNEDTGIALCVTEEGKAATSSCLATLLSDSRFDFSQAYLIGVGSAGGNMDYTTLGDVCIVTAAVDYDLGHQVDSSDLSDPETQSTWYPNTDVLDHSFFRTNDELTEKVLALCQDLTLSTTSTTQEVIARYFPDRVCTTRGPQLIKGSSVTSDNYWKGKAGHESALYKVAYYECPDPYAVTEMEDAALLYVAQQYGLLDRTIILRAVVNSDEFFGDTTAADIWSGSLTEEDLTGGALDIYDVAMNNILLVVDAIKTGIIS